MLSTNTFLFVEAGSRNGSKGEKNVPKMRCSLVYTHSRHDWRLGFSEKMAGAIRRVLNSKLLRPLKYSVGDGFRRKSEIGIRDRRTGLVHCCGLTFPFVLLLSSRHSGSELADEESQRLTLSYSNVLPHWWRFQPIRRDQQQCKL